MWHDVETTKDLLNFTVVADTAAQLVRESGGEPLSIGVSGNWGSGKSSLVKMIGASLRKSDADGKKYVFLEFNAWLYQGYDDARMALLQSVADGLVAESERRQTHVDKALEFAKRVNWLRVGKLLAPTVSGALLGGTVGGPIGAVIGAVGGLCKAGGTPSAEDLKKVTDAYATLQPELAGLLKEKESKSLPQEIAELRATFEELLLSLDVTLVVLVDDVDRCLPDTAISTLEAMRLLLFLPHTAFIIAADEQMIRGAVRTHFGNVDLSDDLVTSYFDKLIQVPLRVPRLGATEVKGYLILLLAELAEKRGDITREARIRAETVILDAVRRSWAGGLTRKRIEEAFGTDATKVSMEIDLADQLASLMVSADRIAGNPRLIKRFLNSLMIRDTVARAQGMTIAFDQLVKLQLFERCAPPAAFEYLVKQVADREDGKAACLAYIEPILAKGESFDVPDPSWDDPFVREWLKLNPRLADTDLRPLLYLSRDRALSLASFDELSAEGRALLDAILEANNFLPPLVERLRSLGEAEGERILNRMRRRARSRQWDLTILVQALHVPRAFPELGSSFVNLLNDIHPSKRLAPFIPMIRSEPWAKELLKRWAADDQSPQPVKNAISGLGKGR
ncbi:MAG: P-loop NTPase fold protein [Candidatus Eisenbacteria bacterium]|nr:P-loop NTPase fold protein [Candidatus Eisenbacteria bacterium]